MVSTDFAEDVKRELERRGFEIIIAPVLKNNGLKLTGITIKRDQATPTLYLDSVPEEHRNPFMVPRIVDDIIESMKSFKGAADSVGDIAGLMGDSEKLLKHIYPRIINYEWNQELLKTLPHRRFLDLAVTYDIDVGDHATCRISNQLMKIADLSDDDLYNLSFAKRYGDITLLF